MITSLIAKITEWQIGTVFAVRKYNEDLNHPNLANMGAEACYFTTCLAFNLAHWFFAFSYLVLSNRIEAVANNLP